MDTQNTPIHIRLWNKDFWFLALANTLFTMAVYMQLVLVYSSLASSGVSWQVTGMAVGCYALGLPLLGPFCSILVQRYRRNMVCIYTMLLTMICLLVPFFCHADNPLHSSRVLVVARMTAGAFFGLAQMVLTSTLVIDTCEARQRTEANYAAAWFGRFAVSLGPLAAILLLRSRGMDIAVWSSAGLTMAAILLVLMVRFPFRTPEDHVRLFSLDRFFLLEAWVLFFNLLVITVAIGLLIAIQLSNPLFFAALILGFLLALIAEKYVFVNAELKSETVCALILIVFAILLMMSGTQTTPYTVPILIGLGMGMIGSRFLLFFIKLSHHSKRGTSQSSFFLSWEMGLAAGMGWGVSMAGQTGGPAVASPPMNVLCVALVFTVVALLLYVIYTHSWYMKHKNR